MSFLIRLYFGVNNFLVCENVLSFFQEFRVDIDKVFFRVFWVVVCICFVVFIFVESFIEIFKFKFIVFLLFVIFFIGSLDWIVDIFSYIVCSI